MRTTVDVGIVALLVRAQRAFLDKPISRVISEILTVFGGLDEPHPILAR